MSNDKKHSLVKSAQFELKEHNLRKMYIWISIILIGWMGFQIWNHRNCQSKNLKYKLVNENLLACEGEHFVTISGKAKNM